MKIPNGFIKDSQGVFRRGSHILSEGRIIRENETDFNTQKIEDLEKATKSFSDVDACIRAVMSYPSVLGNIVRTDNIFIDEDKNGKCKITGKSGKNTVAIITPDNNVYMTKFKEIEISTELKPNTEFEPTKAKEVKDLNKVGKLNESIMTAEDYANARPYETKLTEMLDDGSLEYKTVAEAAISFMSDDEVKRLMEIYDWLYEEEELEEAVSEEVTEDIVEEPKGKEEVVVENKPKSIESAYFIRRPENVQELEDKVSRGIVGVSTYILADEIELSDSEYDNFASNLRQETSFLKTFRPTQSDADFTCIKVSAPGRLPLLVDNSGYNSAQYVGLER